MSDQINKLTEEKHSSRIWVTLAIGIGIGLGLGSNM